MVPEGWNVRAVGEVLERVTRPVSVEDDTEYRQIGIRSHGKGLFDKELVTGRELGNKRVFWVEPNCFVVNIVFAWEQAIGKTTDADAAKIASHRFPMYRPKKNSCDVDFIDYLFKTPKGKYLLGLASPGGAGRNKTLGQKEFDRVRLTLPPLLEQKKIAEILSTWDRAIQVTESLLNNAKAQKRALMQQLLTGKRRFPEFEGRPWKEVPLGDMGRVVSGGTPDSGNPAYWDGDILWATPTDITKLTSRFINSTARAISEIGLKASSAKLVPEGAILICTRATIGELAIATCPICTNQGFKNLVLSKDYDSDFVFYLLQFFKSELIRYACGSTFLELSKKDFEKRSFNVPTLPEQKRIAVTLSAAETQIDERRQDLEKLRAEKKALMQQLLTGKRRVKV